jgi:hypothetical protein
LVRTPRGDGSTVKQADKASPLVRSAPLKIGNTHLLVSMAIVHADNPPVPASTAFVLASKTLLLASKIVVLSSTAPMPASRTPVPASIFILLVGRTPALAGRTPVPASKIVVLASTAPMPASKTPVPASTTILLAGTTPMLAGIPFPTTRRDPLIESKGTKILSDWIQSSNCMKRGINKDTVADVVKRHFRLTTNSSILGR